MGGWVCHPSGGALHGPTLWGDRVVSFGLGCGDYCHHASSAVVDAVGWARAYCWCGNTSRTSGQANGYNFDVVISTNAWPGRLLLGHARLTVDNRFGIISVSYGQTEKSC